MKLWLSLLTAVLLVSSLACRREETAPAPAAEPAPRQKAAAAPPAADVESEVQGIEAHCGEVLGQLSELRKVERDLKGLSTEGGDLQAWLDGKRPALFRATIYGETGRSEPEICFGKGGRLRRATIRESRYDRPLGKVVSTREDKLYFQGETLIRWIGPDGQPVPPDRPEHGAKAKEVLELSQQLVEAAQEGKT